MVGPAGRAPGQEPCAQHAGASRRQRDYHFDGQHRLVTVGHLRTPASRLSTYQHVASACRSVLKHIYPVGEGNEPKSWMGARRRAGGRGARCELTRRGAESHLPQPYFDPSP